MRTHNELDTILHATITNIVQNELQKQNDQLPVADYCTIQRAAKLYGISRPFLYTLINDETIRLYKIRDRSFIRISEMDEAMKLTSYRQNRIKVAEGRRQVLIKKPVKRSGK